MESRKVALENQIKIYGLTALLLGLMIFAFVLYRNNRSKQKVNILLHQQKEEIDLQRNKAEMALSELKATQKQLIQSEKLASLGELTAGIAHEIQNPLNFVNNFSELSIELIEEIAPQPPEGELNAPPLGVGATVAKEVDWEILQDIRSNLQKINHHGKRASSIVKGMLEHSRANTGERALTDINELADEYLRLSYHGMRAKDKTFNASFELVADKNLPKIMVVSQDIGRVLLNLINNAFQSPNSPLTPRGGTFITKKVIVSTRFIADENSPSGGWGAVFVSDNGNGIPKENLEKIFQPFFTTKPTGEGTGLGLSLSYDIITKGHGGTLEVISTEGEGTEFIIKLPI